MIQKTKNDLLDIIKQKAKNIRGYIAFPEAMDERTLRAAKMIVEEETAHPLADRRPGGHQKAGRKTES